MLALACAPGAVALDGAGANGTYTAALLRGLRAGAGEDVVQMLRGVEEEVDAASAGAMRPWHNSSLRGREVPLIPGGPRPPHM